MGKIYFTDWFEKIYLSFRRVASVSTDSFMVLTHHGLAELTTGVLLGCKAWVPRFPQDIISENDAIWFPWSHPINLKGSVTENKEYF